MHIMLRVTNLKRSLEFYTKILGMDFIRTKEYPDGKFTLAFLGYGNEEDNTILELTYNWDTDHYDLGNAYGHIAIEVDDVYKACERISDKGGKITREPGPMKQGKTILAFAEDPDGYKIELLAPKG